MTHSTRTCDEAECGRKHLARGLCKRHYRMKYGRPKVQVKCPNCGEMTTKRADGLTTRRFCSLICRDLWRHETGNNPAPPQEVCRLPKEHPVRVLIRERGRPRPGPLRVAFEARDWRTVLSLLEQQAVKVDDCWLWPRVDTYGYGRIVIAGRSYGTHRIAAMAHLGDIIPSHMPVHHKCAEAQCFNPDHLQVVTPQENVAEMLERRHYQERIAALEAALRSVAPTHPALAPGHPLPTAS